MIKPTIAGSLMLTRLAAVWWSLTGSPVSATSLLGSSSAYAFGYNYSSFSVPPLRQQKRQNLRQLQIGFPSIYTHNPRSGTIKVLVLLIQFSDHNDRTLVSKEFIESMWNGVMKDWFAVNSHGIYSIEPVVTDWIVTDNTEKFYADGQRGFHPEFKKAMFPALDKLDADNWDWSQFDSDGDGRLDSVVVMHSGISALVSAPGAPDGLDCFGINPTNDRIWPHAFVASKSDETWYNEAETVHLNGYTVNSVYDSFCDDLPLTPGLTLHEFMHTMDTIDLYDSDFSAKGTGFWDIMSHPYGADNSGTPGLLGAWTKYVVGWLEPIPITSNGEYISKPAHTHPEAYLIDLAQPDAPAREYLLIENRQPIGFEEPLEEGGLLIWHIDDLADGMIEAGPHHETGKHYQVAILPKDGKYDLERNEPGYGDTGDLFMTGDTLGPGQGNTIHPNTDSYQDGIVETGILIEVLEQRENGDIVFSISGLKQQADSGATSNENPDTPAPTVAPTIAAAAAASPAPELTTTEQPAMPPTSAAPVQGPESAGTAQPVGGETATIPEPVPEYVSATAAPVGMLAEPPRWTLTRVPGPTRAPFVLPEMPYMKPLENTNEGVEDDSKQKSSSSCVTSLWIRSMVSCVLSTLLWHYVV